MLSGSAYHTFTKKKKMYMITDKKIFLKYHFFPKYYLYDRCKI